MNKTERIGPYSFTQPENGQRLTSDTVCLVNFIAPLKPNDTVIDLGAGAGVIPIMLAATAPSVSITGVEIDAEAAENARDNVKANGLEERITIINKDLREMIRMFEEGSFSVVVSNPPYRKANAGRPSPDKTRELARAESATLAELIDASKYLAGKDGRIFYVFPVARLFEMLKEARTAGLTPRRLKFAHARPDRAAKFFMVEFAADGALVIEEPVVL
ncbi:MAG: methyltransferase [Deltaproteobacteria bacterium]|nr:methyltransferase [Deltaproteobacteria bacterium]